MDGGKACKCFLAGVLVKYIKASIRTACPLRMQSQSRAVRTLNIYYNDRAVTDLGELRNKWSQWRKVHTVTLSRNQVWDLQDLTQSLRWRSLLGVLMERFYDAMEN